MKIRPIFLTAIFLCLTSVVMSQTDSAVVDTDTIYKAETLKEAPNFRGGEAALDRYIDNKVVITDRAYKYAKSGTVIVAFTVEKDGDLSNIRCIHRRRVGYGVEESCVKLFDEMPPWEPGKIDGEPVRSKTTKSIIMNM